MHHLGYLTRCAGRPPPRGHPYCYFALREGGAGCKPLWAVGLMVALVVSGCAGSRTIVESSSVRAVPADHAFVSLGPAGPAVLSVLESDYANATRQTITLATRGKTPGENQVRVDVLGVKNEDVALDTSIPDLPLKEAELQAEAQEALPDVPLRVSNSYLQNRYGPFGYIVGKTARGETCVYAWQRLTTPDLKLSVANSRNTISLRLRLCDPRANEAALAATMMNLSVNVALSSGSWTPDPKELSADIGAPSAPMAPPQIALAVANPLQPAREAPVRARHAARAPAPEPASDPISAVQPPVLTGVVVPPPPLATFSAQVPARADSALPPPQISVPSPPGEPRQ
jgi:hypothetical protein